MADHIRPPLILACQNTGNIYSTLLVTLDLNMDEILKVNIHKV